MNAGRQFLLTIPAADAAILPMHSAPNMSRVSRRRFIQIASMASGGVLGFPAILRSQSPSRRLNLAVIGVGGRGASNMAGVAGENIVALCDVNATNLQAAAAKHPGAKQFRDFRKM